MYLREGAVMIEADDQCDTCRYYSKRQTCPLLEALSSGAVLLCDAFNVRRCRFFQARHMRPTQSPGG